MIDFRTIPKKYQRYYTYLEPVMADPLVRGYFSLIASMLLVAFFIIFAISPTIDTILTLRKKITDQKATLAALDTKIANLITAQENYQQVENLIPVLETALPKTPVPQTIISTILESASRSGVTITGLQFREIPLSDDLLTQQSGAQENSATMIPKGLYVVPFSLSLIGQKSAVRNYLGSLETSLRYLRAENLGVQNSEDNANVTVEVRGLSYYYYEKK